MESNKEQIAATLTSIFFAMLGSVPDRMPEEKVIRIEREVFKVYDNFLQKLENRKPQSTK